MIRSLLVFVAACGSPAGVAPKDTRPGARDVLVGDATKIQRVLRDSVVNGGLRFDDPKCTEQFGVPGEVRRDQLADFARCLAGLQLQPSARQDALGDVIVMKYAPGFEVQARVVNENDGLRLTWIGFASRVQGDLDVPSITHDALEQLRLSGDRRATLDPKIASGLELDTTPGTRAAYTWFKVCLDPAGEISKADPYETTSSKTSTAFAEAIRTWRFRPFVMRGAALPVCAMVRMAYPADAAPPVETLPLPPPPSRSKKRPVVLTSPKLLEGKRIAGSIAIVPDDETKVVIQESGVTRITGQFRMCIDDTGAIESVFPMRSTGLARYDARITAGMLQWKYSPYMVDDQPVPVCTYITFIYSQQGRPVKVVR
ncbi:MAG: hypothetical protein M4D80_28920 [Myxococcota bacterium]|nr:hypothetical protein [Deltaproteobacteria bacterium]MDQ3339204.1 hypothetical protein [Myxococcota bacterium]